MRARIEERVAVAVPVEAAWAVLTDWEDQTGWMLFTDVIGCTAYDTGSRAIAMRTMSTYSRVRASGRANGTPCHPSTTCGPETPSPSRKRPPESTSSPVAVMAVMAGVRAGIWKMAEPMSMRVVWAAIQASMVAASVPYASATQATE